MAGPRVLMIAPTHTLSRDRRILQTCDSLAEGGATVDVVIPWQVDPHYPGLQERLRPGIHLHEFPEDYHRSTFKLDLGSWVPFRHRSWLLHSLLSGLERFVRRDERYVAQSPWPHRYEILRKAYLLYWKYLIPWIGKKRRLNSFYMAAQLGPKRYNKIRRLSALNHLNPWYFFKGMEICGGRAPDVIYCHDVWSLGGACALKTIWNVPLIFDAHDIGAGSLGDDDLTNKSDRDQEVGLRMADVFLTVNRSVAEYFKRLYPWANPQLVLNAPKYWPKKPSEPTIKEMIGKKPDSIVGVFIGYLNFSPALEAFVDAIAHTKSGMSLVIIGGGNAEEPLRRHAAERGLLGNRVFVLGAMPYAKILPTICSADFGIIPSIQNWVNFGINSPAKMYDYVQAELPIFSDKGVEVENVLGHYGNGLTHDLSSPEPVKLAALMDEFCTKLNTFGPGVQKAKTELIWPTDLFDRTVAAVLKQKGSV